MLKRILVATILFFIIIHPQFSLATEYRDIEIFDPRKDTVVKSIKTNDEINTMIKDWLHGIDEVCLSVNPIKDDGYTIRFPLNPAMKIQNALLDTTLEEVYLIVPESDPPFFIIFTDENRALCFVFPGDIGELSRVLDFKLD